MADASDASDASESSASSRPAKQRRLEVPIISHHCWQSCICTYIYNYMYRYICIYACILYNYTYSFVIMLCCIYNYTITSLVINSRYITRKIPPNARNNDLHRTAGLPGPEFPAEPLRAQRRSTCARGTHAARATRGGELCHAGDELRASGDKNQVRVMASHSFPHNFPIGDIGGNHLLVCLWENDGDVDWVASHLVNPSDMQWT
jgi:hypothetical protein